MDRRSVENMKLDRRLIERRGWISEKDLQRELDALPDVSDKAATDDDDEDSSDDTVSESAIDNAPETPPEYIARPATSAPDISLSSGSSAGSNTDTSPAFGAEPDDAVAPSEPTDPDAPPN